MTDTSMRVIRHESELGFWKLVRPAPDPGRGPHVRSYCGYVERGKTPLGRRELPSGEVVVVLGFGPSIRVDGEPRSPSSQASTARPRSPSTTASRRDCR